jgi:hypothetical protein
MERVYRGLKLRAAVRQGRAQAAIFAGPRRLHLCDGQSVEAAMASAQAYVDHLFAEAAAARRKPFVATVDEFVRYFAANPPAEHELAMLEAHASAAERTMTAGELAQAAGWQSYRSANAHYGKLGRRVTEALALPIRDGKADEWAWTNALAEDAGGQVSRDSPLFRWRMHPELADALRALGIAA